MNYRDALEGIKQRINYALNKPENVDTPERQQKRIDKSAKQIGVIEQAINELESLKRIPTVDEILKLLSEITETEVLYSTVTHEFYYVETETDMNEDYLYEQFITETYGDGKWSFNMYLPLNVIQMIVRFYKEIERGEK